MSSGRRTLGIARPSVFVDRDGTLIEDAHYISDPAKVVLIPHAASAVRTLNNALVPVIVVTNQSGIARKKVTPAEYQQVQQRFEALLAEQNAFVDATYMCPHHPDVDGPCACRKPGTLLYEQAIADLNLNGKESAFIGDRLRDVLPARAFGGRGILVPSRDTPAEELDTARREFEVIDSLLSAVESFLGPGGPFEPA